MSANRPGEQGEHSSGKQGSQDSQKQSGQQTGRATQKQHDKSQSGQNPSHSGIGKETRQRSQGIIKKEQTSDKRAAGQIPQPRTNRFHAAASSDAAWADLLAMWFVEEE